MNDKDVTLALSLFADMLVAFVPPERWAGWIGALLERLSRHDTRPNAREILRQEIETVLAQWQAAHTW